jgi:hypothetical protein
VSRDTESTGSPHPSPAARWSELCDALIRGIAHSLSNRVGALMALAHAERGELTSAEAAMLGQEVNRLAEINRLLKLLPADRSPRREGLIIEDVLVDVTALLAVHPQLRDVAWETSRGDAQPVRTERWAILRVLLLLLERAAMSSSEHRVVVTTSGDQEHVRVRVHPVAPIPAATVRLAEHEDDLPSLVERLGAELTHESTAVVLSLPTITEARRRDLRAPTSA